MSDSSSGESYSSIFSKGTLERARRARSHIENYYRYSNLYCMSDTCTIW